MVQMSGDLLWRQHQLHRVSARDGILDVVHWTITAGQHLTVESFWGPIFMLKLLT